MPSASFSVLEFLNENQETNFNLFLIVMADRVSVSPSGIFSSRELEMETRTLLLKRLAFTLFCTDGDQYQRFLPDIQGSNHTVLMATVTYGIFKKMM